MSCNFEVIIVYGLMVWKYNIMNVDERWKKKKNLVNIVIYVFGLRKRMNVYLFFFLFVILLFFNDLEMVFMSYFFNVF